MKSKHHLKLTIALSIISSLISNYLLPNSANAESPKNDSSSKTKSKAKNSSSRKMSNEEIIKKIESEKFVEIRKVTDLPAKVQAYYKSASGASDIKDVMADSGEDYQAGCVQKPGGAPSKSFIAGGKSESLCLAYYESGGFVLLDTADLFLIQDSELQDSKVAEKIWSSSMFGDHPKKMEQLLKSVLERLKNPIN